MELALGSLQRLVKHHLLPKVSGWPEHCVSLEHSTAVISGGLGAHPPCGSSAVGGHCLSLTLQDSAESVIGMLRNLLVAGVEEVRVVQTLLLLVSVPEVVGGRVLGKAFLLAVALRESRNPTLSHTASAAVSQMVSSAFDRAGSSLDDSELCR